MKLCTLVVIVNKNKGEKVLRALEEKGLNYIHATPGTGTAPSALSALMGTGETDKLVVAGTVEDSRVKDIFDMLENEFALCEKNTGIAFTLPVNSVGGPATLSLLAGEIAGEGGKNGI